MEYFAPPLPPCRAARVTPCIDFVPMKLPCIVKESLITPVFSPNYCDLSQPDGGTFLSPPPPENLEEITKPDAPLPPNVSPLRCFPPTPSLRRFTCCYLSALPLTFVIARDSLVPCLTQIPPAASFFHFFPRVRRRFL